MYAIASTSLFSRRCGFCNGNSLSNHSLTSMPVLVKNSASKMTSYLQVSDWNMSAFCWSIFLLLSNSGLRKITTSVDVEVPARIFICLLLEILHGLQFLGKHFLLIIVVVDPDESNNTFSKILDLTEEMVSTTMMVTGVILLGTAFLSLSISS